MNPVDHPHGGGNHQHIGKDMHSKYRRIISNIICRQGFHHFKICSTGSKGGSHCCSENWSVAGYAKGQGLRDGLTGFHTIRTYGLCVNVLADGVQLGRNREFKDRGDILALHHCDNCSLGKVYRHTAWSNLGLETRFDSMLFVLCAVTE